MLEIEIDGKGISVADGSTIMDAAAKVDTYIPHFCYHKKLSIAANCRMCLVEVEKAPKAMPACATPVTNGMKVWTHSEAAVRAQKAVMEFLLVNHPLDCPICDQGGECLLQDLAVGYGGSHSRYQEEKRVVVSKYLGPLIATAMTRCINCTRCVRFTQEIAGRMELGQAYRGEHAEIMPFLERTVDSELSGNVIDLCPVGALISKPFRFTARSWELARRRSISPHDSLGSNLIVQVKRDRVMRVLPYENEDINECWLSDKDRFSYEGLNSEERLTAPMIKQGGEWRKVDWPTALEYVGNALHSVSRDYGPDRIGALASPHATVEELYLLQKLVRGLGSGNIDFRLRQNDFRSDGKRSGAPWLGMAITDVAKLDRLLVIGSFLRKDAPLLAQRVRQAAKRGLQVMAVSSTAEDWALPVAPRATVAPSALVATLAQIVAALAREKGAALPALLVGTDIDDGEEARAIAQALAQGQQVAVWLGNFAIHSDRAAEVQALAQTIAQLANGRLGIIGEAANSVGGYLAGALPDGAGRNVRAMLEEPCQAYVLLNAEPDLDFANPAAALHALGKAATVIALTSFTSSALLDKADVMLPIAPFTETSGTFVNCEGRAQSFTAVAPAAGESRPAWKVLRVLGNLLDLSGFDYNDSEAVLAEVLKGDIASQLDNAIGDIEISLADDPAAGLERIADVPLHFADPLVRRSPPLQQTRDARAPAAAIHPETLAELGIEDGDQVTVRKGEAQVVLTALADCAVARGCAQISAAHETTVALGPMFGRITVERA